MPELYDIKNVEVFASGTWNGDTYKDEDLDKMVEAYNNTKDRIKPILKLGHTNNQKLAQDDGLPSMGIVENLRRIGNKLVADFSRIPKTIYELIKNEAYRKVSSEIYWNFNMDSEKQEKYPYFLGGVALLGEDMPAVSSLKDILALYKNLTYNKLKTYTLDKEQPKMSDKKTEQEIKLETEIKKYKSDLEKEQKEIAKYKKELDAEKKKSEQAIEEAKQTADKVAEYERKNLELNLEAALDGFEKKELSCKGMRPYLKELLGEDKKEYSIKIIEDEKEIEKKFSKQEILEQLLTVTKEYAKVNFDEDSLDDDKCKKGDNEDEIVEKTNEYMKKHNCSAGEAYRAVINESKE